jgi:hypothetical protein
MNRIGFHGIYDYFTGRSIHQILGKTNPHEKDPFTSYPVCIISIHSLPEKQRRAIDRQRIITENLYGRYPFNRI